MSERLYLPLLVKGLPVRWDERSLTPGDATPTPSRSTGTESGFFAHHGVWAPGVRLFRRLRFSAKAMIISLAFVVPLLGLIGWQLALHAEQANAVLVFHQQQNNQKPYLCTRMILRHIVPGLWPNGSTRWYQKKRFMKIPELPDCWIMNVGLPGIFNKTRSLQSTTAPPSTFIQPLANTLTCRISG